VTSDAQVLRSTRRIITTFRLARRCQRLRSGSNTPADGLGADPEAMVQANDLQHRSRGPMDAQHLCEHSVDISPVADVRQVQRHLGN
jgi:hypothetical protein